MKLRQATRFGTTAMATIALVSTAAAGSSAARSDVTLRDSKTGFSVSAPAGFRLSENRGVYLLHKGGESIGFSRTVTTTSAAQAGPHCSRSSGDGSSRAEEAAPGSRPWCRTERGARAS